MGKSTLEMVGKLLAEDAKTISKQREAADKGKGYYGGISPDYNESLTIRKADAGGMIVCWYGPNGSRDIIVKDADEAAGVIKKFFEGTDAESEDDGE